jgi:general secretion pathway protein G
MATRRRRRRAAFTLMEILLVTAILVAMASMATFAYVSIMRNATARNARTEIGLLESACTAYYSSVNAFPQTLRELQVMPQGMDASTWGGPYIDVKKDLRDPWQTDYRYSIDETGLTVTIASAGPDRSFNTADDISNNATNQ